MDTKIHVPVYDGKQNNFDKWREKFEGYCYTKGCGECLYKDGGSNLPNAMKGQFSKEASTEKTRERSGTKKYKGNGFVDDDFSHTYV